MKFLCSGKDLRNVLCSPDAIKQNEPREPLPVNGPDRESRFYRGIKMIFKDLPNFWHFIQPAFNCLLPIRPIFNVPSDPETIAHDSVHCLTSGSVDR